MFCCSAPREPILEHSGFYHRKDCQYTLKFRVTLIIYQRNVNFVKLKEVFMMLHNKVCEIFDLNLLGLKKIQMNRKKEFVNYV